MFRKLPDFGEQDLLDHVMLTAYLAEYAEWDNRSHLDRIRRYGHILADGLGLGPDESNVISLASILHDIGKISLPVSLLRKTGDLEPDEYKMAEQHTLEGRRMLSASASPIMEAAAVIALTHHERWDGSGYPEGRRGEAVQVSGRIAALADVFDALTTRRSYKTTMQPGAALQLIQGSSGTLFDPTLVSIFVERFSDVMAVLRAHGDAA